MKRTSSMAVATLAFFANVLLGGTAWPANAKGTVIIDQSYLKGNGLIGGVVIQPFAVDHKSKFSFFYKPLAVLPGEHVVTLRVEFQVIPQNVLLEQMRKFVLASDAEVILEPGRNYTAAGKVSGSVVNFWIEDSQSHQQVSHVTEITVPECKPFNCPDPVVRKSSLY